MKLLCDNARPQHSVHVTARQSHILDGQCYRIHPTVHTITFSPVLSYENIFKPRDTSERCTPVTAERKKRLFLGVGAGIQAVFQNLKKTINKDEDFIEK